LGSIDADPEEGEGPDRLAHTELHRRGPFRRRGQTVSLAMAWQATRSADDAFSSDWKGGIGDWIENVWRREKRKPSRKSLVADFSIPSIFVGVVICLSPVVLPAAAPSSIPLSRSHTSRRFLSARPHCGAFRARHRCPRSGDVDRVWREEHVAGYRDDAAFVALVGLCSRRCAARPRDGRPTRRRRSRSRAASTGAISPDENGGRGLPGVTITVTNLMTGASTDGHYQRARQVPRSRPPPAGEVFGEGGGCKALEASFVPRSPSTIGSAVDVNMTLAKSRQSTRR